MQSEDAGHEMGGEEREKERERSARIRNAHGNDGLRVCRVKMAKLPSKAVRDGDPGSRVYG